MFTGKNGVEPSEAIKLAKFIIEKCSELEFCGLMTIGASNHDVSLGPNPDFLVRFAVSIIIAKVILIFVYFQ
jgi:hypothetical protein